MRIQSKLTIVEAIIAAGFFVAIVVSIFFTNSAIELKNIEYQTGEVFSSMEKLNYSAKTLLTTAKNLKDLRADLQRRVDDFDEQLNKLADQKGIKFLGKKSIKNYEDVLGWWKQLKDWYLTPEFKRLDGMIDRGFVEMIGSQGIMQAYLEHKDENSAMFGAIISLKNYQDNVLENSEIFMEKLSSFLEELTTQSEYLIRYNFFLVVGIIILTVLVSIILINIIAWRISMRIRLVEGAIKTVAEGDFSRDLIIRSGDEFEDLSKHYNAFKTELWKKLDSVLGFMIDISVSLSEGLDIEHASEKILQSVVKNSSADAGAVFMLDDNQTHLNLAAVHGDFPCPFEVPEPVRESIERQIDFLREYKIPIGKTIIGQAVKTGEEIFIKKSSDTDFLSANTDPEDPQFISSIGIIPLVITRRVLGVIVLVKTTPGESFTDVDFTNMRTFGDYAALTIDNLYNYTEAVQKTEMERELKIAAGIQKNMLPERIPEVSGFSIGVFSRAAETVSSDYYDVFKLGKGKTAVILCDVVGKGVPASLLMVMIRTMIRMVAPSAKSSDHMLRIINKGLRKKIGVEQYATMGVLLLDEKTREIEYSNAAHSPLLYFDSQKKEFIQIDTPGLPIGVEPDETYSRKKLKPAKGDLFILYTDGVLDSQNEKGENYSLDRMKEIILSSADFPAEMITDAVLKDITDFIGNAEKIDDQTLLVIKAV